MGVDDVVGQDTGHGMHPDRPSPSLADAEPSNGDDASGVPAVSPGRSGSKGFPGHASFSAVVNRGAEQASAEAESDPR